MNKIIFLNIKKSNKYIYISISKDHTNIITVSSNQKLFQILKTFCSEKKTINLVMHSYLREKIKESGIRFLFLNKIYLNSYKNLV